MDYKTLLDLKSRLLPAIIIIFVGFGCLFANSLVFSVLAALVLAVIFYELFFYAPHRFLLLKISSYLVCLIGVSLLIFLRVVFGVEMCIYLICAASGADIGGYIFGKFIGGPKLCPRISPNKTIAGFFGGILFANILCLICDKYFGLKINIYITQIIIISAILGDLWESMLKRVLNIKDFGTSLGGHGGVLDRFDSLIFSVIACCVFLVLCN